MFIYLFRFTWYELTMKHLAIIIIYNYRLDLLSVKIADINENRLKAHAREANGL